MFGLLNANARLYSPYLGRFISPDPLLNSEGGPLDYNPYIYARNNPYKYIDRNGEFWWLVAPAILGGFTSAFTNFDCINSIGDFFANYGPSLLASGIATVAGIAVGGVVTAGCASVGIVTLAPVIAAGASGAAVYLTYNCVYSACTGTPFNFSWTDLGFDVGLAVATAGAGVIARKLAPKLSKIMQSRHKPIVTGPDAMAAKAEAGKAITPSAEASGIAKETGIQARQSSAAMHSNAGLLERTGKSVTTFTGEVYIPKSDPHYLELLKEAQARYPKKAGHMQWHHIDPKYMGGARNGKLIQIDAAYHQMITNEFRKWQSYGLDKLEESARRSIMQKVYMKYPLPQ